MNLGLLKEYGRLKTYDSDDRICEQGETGHTAFLLLDGRANVEHVANGKKTVFELEPGVLFGEMSLLEDRPRVASVVAAVQGTVVLEIGKEHFLDLIKAEPDIGYGLMRTMLARVNNTLATMGFGKLEFVSEIKRDKNYKTLQNLSREQFIEIVEKDSGYAHTLLKFLSYTLAKVDRNI